MKTLTGGCISILLAMALAGTSAAAQPRQADHGGGDQAGGVVDHGGRAPRPELTDARIAGFFDDYMRAKVKELDVPGAALVVLRDGRPILSRGYGLADTAAKRRVDPDRTLFRSASVSKVLRWLLVMQLVEQGRLDLDRDVNDYLDFHIQYRFGRPITLRHLMTHTAGLAERLHGAFDPELRAPLGDVLKNNVPDQAYPPGRVVAYSNYGAALAGYIVERAYRRPWADIVRERIFLPAGMTDASVEQPPAAPLRARVAAT